MTVLEKDGWFDYKMNASAVYNIYNYLSVIALLREMGYERRRLPRPLKSSALFSPASGASL